ncbi:hypothetical protein [Kitasatospora albolonga]|uniref:hypothetical protein n=1 Tax=Kitasatospora albolonga TaxID=68173 RepID=UPI0035E9C712
MSTPSPRPGELSLSPVYPFNQPGEPIKLYAGPIDGLSSTEVAGVVELTCGPRLSLDWKVEGGDFIDFAFRSDVSLVLHRQDGNMQLQGVPRDNDGGWSNGAVFGDADAPLKRIVAHWFNVPRLRGSVDLKQETSDGAYSWQGRARWRFETGGWKITLDVRPDHSDVWADFHGSQIYVMTHVMELCRADGSSFTAHQAEPVMSALHVGLSFALGQWVAPMLPVGLGEQGEILWEDWRSLHCDPAQRRGSAWWYEQETDSLEDFLARAIAEFVDPARRAALRLQMMFAITATVDRGFVEQRITSAAAGLEHIMWQNLVLSGKLTKQEYESRAWPAARLLRKALAEAKIPVDIPDDLLPTVDRYVKKRRSLYGENLDCPDVVTRMRNRIVHPKEDQAELYELEGLVTEVWLAARHYLTLLILNSVGYRGIYRDLRKISGWVGDVGTVPWS